MSNGEDTDTLTLDPELHGRLSTLADRAGTSLQNLAEAVLRSHVVEQERLDGELVEDEQRWQRYLADGQAVPFELVRKRLRELAADAASRATAQ